MDTETATWIIVAAVVLSYLAQRHRVKVEHHLPPVPSAQHEVHPYRWRHNGKQPITWRDGNRRPLRSVFQTEHILREMID
jgi:hypothetical protein